MPSAGNSRRTIYGTADARQPRYGTGCNGHFGQTGGLKQIPGASAAFDTQWLLSKNLVHLSVATM
jgi:hypothetical protein